MKLNPSSWAQATQVWTAFSFAFAGLIAVSEGQQALGAIEWAFPAHRGYVRDVVLSTQADVAVRQSVVELKSDAHFSRLEELLLQANIAATKATLVPLRIQRIQLMDLLVKNPGDPTIRLQLVTLDADIAAAEGQLTEISCQLAHQNSPNFGGC